MLNLTKRTLAILLVAIIGIGSGIGVGIFIFIFSGENPPDEETYHWSASDCPGAPSSITADQIIKIGCAGDTGTLQGDANYNGTWFAAKEINEAGGIDVNGKTYYFGVTSEDTDECNPNLNVSRAVSAAKKLINNKTVDFAIGGFRSEALLAYVEEFMDTETIFLSTGALDDIFCKKVIYNYETFKYFFRFMPINSTELVFQIIETLADFILEINNTYLSHDVKQIGILAENLTWTAPIISMIQTYLPFYVNIATGGLWWADILTPILFDTNINGSEMNMHLQSLQSDGADIVIPLISGSGGVLMMQQYELNQYEYLIFGVDEQSQLTTFWEESGESCSYETIVQAIYRTNMSNTTIAFWDAFIAEFGHEPLYNAVGAYDAVNGLKDAIVATQSLVTNDIIAYIETWTPSNSCPNVLGEGAWWSNSHDLVGGYPYGYPLWCQWHPNGTKIVIPTSIYPNSLSTGAYIMPPWVHTAWTPEIWITPGVPDGVDFDHILRIGISGDVGEITGDGAYEGAYLAAKEINEAGGMTVGTDTYYFGLVREDTDEDNPNLVTSIGVAAAEKLVYDSNIQFAIGGSRTEAVLAYQEVFMDNDIIFMSTGVATDIFTDNVRNYYDRYKYYFRVMPTNSTTAGGQMFYYFATMIGTMNYLYGAGTIHEIGVIAEDVTWTESMTEFLSEYIPYTGCVIPEDCLIRYDMNLSWADMNTYMQTMIYNGVDMIIPVISGQGGIMMMQQYAALKPNAIVVGIDAQSQLDTFWEQSQASCAYETVMQALYDVNKTPTSKAFWAAFRAEWDHDPFYTAIGAYDAVNNLAWAIETGQTIDNDELIPVLENKTKANILSNPSAFPSSPSGLGAWWPNSHEVVGGFPYGYTLWVQWTPYGTKQVVPGFDYGDTYIAPCGTYLLPPWVEATWSA